MIPEIIILALTIYMESRGEPLQGKIAVGQVIQERMIEKHKSAAGVCLQRKQFSCWNIGVDEVHIRHINGELVKNKVDKKAWRDCLQIARRVVRRSLPRGRSWNHYHSTKVNPSWSAAMKDTEIIGNHKFGRI